MAELVRWRPRRLLAELQGDLWPSHFGRGRIQGFFGSPLGWPQPEVWSPPCDVLTRGEDLVVRVELPGIDPEHDVAITFEDGMLCVTGERKREERTDSEQMHRVESWVGAFERSIRLPASADPSKITATYQDGLLEVLVPKAAAPVGRKVPVTAKAPGTSGAGGTRSAA